MAPPIIHQGNPAKKSTNKPLAATKIDVPKSGSLAIKSTGIAMIIKVVKTVLMLGGNSFLDKYQAHIMGMPSFINSDG